MREQGERNWNGEIAFSKLKGGDLPMVITRTLESVCRGLARLEGQGKVEGFFNNAENADKLSGAVEDIRDAMMEYQVCIHNLLSPASLMFAPDFITARYLQQELSTHCELRSTVFCPC